MISSQIEIQEELNRLANRWGEKSFSVEVMKRIRFYTKRMKAKDVKKMVNFFLDNNRYAPLPRDFADYAKSHGFGFGRQEPTTNCPNCKNRGLFTAIKNGHKYAFDCPQICEWNRYLFGSGKKNPWKSEYRKQGFLLEHETLPDSYAKTDMLANSIQLGAVGLAKALLKNTGMDTILEDFERGRNKPCENETRSSDLVSTKEILSGGKDDLPF